MFGKRPWTLDDICDETRIATIRSLHHAARVRIATLADPGGTHHLPGGPCTTDDRARARTLTANAIFNGGSGICTPCRTWARSTGHLAALRALAELAGLADLDDYTIETTLLVAAHTNIEPIGGPDPALAWWKQAAGRRWDRTEARAALYEVLRRREPTIGALHPTLTTRRGPGGRTTTVPNTQPRFEPDTGGPGDKHLVVIDGIWEPRDLAQTLRAVANHTLQAAPTHPGPDGDPWATHPRPYVLVIDADWLELAHQYHLIRGTSVVAHINLGAIDDTQARQIGVATIEHIAAQPPTPNPNRAWHLDALRGHAYAGVINHTP